MTTKNRLAQLEKRSKPSAEINPYMTMPKRDLEDILRRVAAGEIFLAQPSDPQTDALRADILRRWQRKAEAQNDNKE